MEINETNFLDENFRKYVAENCDSNGDGVLSVEEQLNKCNVCVESEKDFLSDDFLLTVSYNIYYHEKS